jgi:hypothetical protein
MDKNIVCDNLKLLVTRELTLVTTVWYTRKISLLKKARMSIMGQLPSNLVEENEPTQYDINLML